MTETQAVPPVTHLPGAPEAAFRVGDVIGNGQRATSTMRAGSWLLGPDARPSFGALGVLLDITLGATVVAHRPAGGWAVTTEIGATFCASPDLAAGDLTARAAVAHLDHAGGVAQGTIHDGAGRLVATAHERIRYTTVSPRAGGQPDATPESADDLLAFFDCHPEPDRSGGLTLNVGKTSANPGGVLHGGVSIYLSEIAASMAVGGDGSLRPASLHIAFLRPGLLGEAVRYRPRIQHLGARSALVHVHAVRGDGQPCTMATIGYHTPGV
jgi:acyl-coenzyme A thioesterase PaaI-like protein